MINLVSGRYGTPAGVDKFGIAEPQKYLELARAVILNFVISVIVEIFKKQIDPLAAVKTT